MRLLVVSNCQTEGLAEALRAFHPGAEVEAMPLWDAERPGGRALVVERLRAADYALIAHGRLDKPIEKAREAGRIARIARVPRIRFRAFQPDMIHVGPWNGRYLSGATAIYHSRIAVCGYLAGLAAEDVPALYNRLAFARLGYLNRFPIERALLLESFAACGYDAAPFVSLWLRDGAFMYTLNHPHPRVMRDTAFLACEQLGIAPARLDLPEAALADHLAHAARHPVFAEVGAAIGVPPRDGFAAEAPRGETARPMSVEAFCERSFTAFGGYPREVMLESDGVRAAMAALGLREAPPAGKRDARARHALISYHGTVLRRLPGGVLFGAPVADPNAAGEEVVLSLPMGGLSRPERTAELDGALLEPRPDGLVQAMRERKYLCAERDTVAAGFTRARAGEWESFLPLTVPRLRLLRRLLGGNWRVAPAEDAPASAATKLTADDIRLRAGFVLQVGTARFDLTMKFPLEPSGAEDLRLHLPEGGALQLSPIARAPAGPAILAPGERLVLQGEIETLHLPLVARGARWRWCHAANLPPLGARRLAVTLRRGGAAPGGAVPGGAAPGGAAPAGAPDEAGGRGRAHIAAFAPPELGNAELEAAIRLHVLERFAPPGARLLVPPEADTRMLRALGFTLPMETMPPGAVPPDDVLSLEQPGLDGLPAVALADFQARAAAYAPAGPAGLRVVLAGEAAGLPAEAVQMLRARGFSRFDPAEQSPAELLAALTRAEILVAAGPALAHLVLLPEGAAVIDLAEGAFQPARWQAARSRLRYGVCPMDALDDLPALFSILDAFG